MPVFTPAKGFVILLNKSRVYHVRSKTRFADKTWTKPKMLRSFTE